MDDPNTAVPTAQQFAAPIERTHDYVLTASQTAKLLGVHIRSLRRLVYNGEAPERVKLTTRRYGFRASAIERWLAERVCHEHRCGPPAKIMRAPSPARPGTRDSTPGGRLKHNVTSRCIKAIAQRA
jgi:predicted DNA-binding transcriptional regulator AlpA